jgi:methyltransferase-like protein
MKTTTLIISIVFSFLLVTQIYSQNVVQNLSVSQLTLRPLIATKQEVNQFLKNYIERYTNKDIDGFLWLFSLKAVQNQKDGLPGIREIYSHFFDQTQTLHCRIEDRKVEIYENALEVRARYEIEQIVKKGGGKKVWRGRIRWVLIREDGILKIVSLDYQHERPS